MEHTKGAIVSFQWFFFFVCLIGMAFHDDDDDDDERVRHLYGSCMAQCGNPTLSCLTMN